MPIFTIRVVNQNYVACNEQDLPTAGDARAQAIKSALRIGIAEVSEASPFFGAEVMVGDGGGQIARFVVSIGVSPIQSSELALVET